MDDRLVFKIIELTCSKAGTGGRQQTLFKNRGHWQILIFQTE